jgi:hypothetical protein
MGFRISKVAVGLWKILGQDCALLVGLVFASTTALAGGPYFEKGLFVGSGWCKTERGTTETFQSKLSVDGWDIEHIVDGGKFSRKLRFSTSDRGYGFFDISISRQKAGDGYCTSTPCHLDMAIDHQPEEWTLTFTDEAHNNLRLMRSFRRAAGLVACEEDLKRETTARR